MSCFAVAFAVAGKLTGASEAEAAWRTLSAKERRRLTDAAHALFANGKDVHLALCAMRTVGDTTSLKLIDQSVGHRFEGTTQSFGGPKEPSWEPIRREAIERRNSAG